MDLDEHGSLLIVCEHFIGKPDFLTDKPTHLSRYMIVQQTATDRIASRLLAQYGIAFIWDTHVAAAAAYGLGNLSIAKDLTAIAEAGEAAWLARNRDIFASDGHQA